MNINDKLNDISRKIEENNMKILNIKSEIRTFTRDLKRAKSDTSKASIQNENIAPLKKQLSSLRLNGEALSMQLYAIESHVLGEELKTRQSGTTTITKLDNKYRFKFLFSRFRRFGNFTGYLSGRKEEADNTIKNYLIKKIVIDYIRSVGKDTLFSKFEIDPNSKTANSDLIHSIIENKLVEFDDLDAHLSMFIGQVINKDVITGSADRKAMLTSLQKNVPKRSPKTPYLDSVEELGEEEVGDGER